MPRWASSVVSSVWGCGERALGQRSDRARLVAWTGRSTCCGTIGSEGDGIEGKSLLIFAAKQ